MANLRWILPGSSKVWTLDQVCVLVKSGKIEFPEIDFSVWDGLWGHVVSFGINLALPGSIWESFWSLRRRPGIKSGPPEDPLGVISGSEIEEIPKFGFGVVSWLTFCRSWVSRKDRFGNIALCRHETLVFGGRGPAANSVDESADAVPGSPGGGCGGSGGGKGGIHKFDTPMHRKTVRRM